jgi:4-amino-4-deoxy-L-arabinose transferase-like glycosyltransferase
MTAPASPSFWSRDLILLVLLFAAFYGFRLGSYPLANPDEGRNAEIPREMVASGDWVTPRLDGVNYFEKPPLVYWTVAGCLNVFGPNEWSVRAAPLLFALGGVLFTYAATRRIYGRSAGLAAALVLGTSLLYYALARFLILDMAVSALMSATLFCFILGVREPPPAPGAGGWAARRRWWFYGLYASAALATLTKGLMGFLVTGAVMFLWLLLFNQWKRLRPFYLPTGALLFLALAAPWHLLVSARNPTWFHRYVVYEHVERFMTPAAGRAGPWWYFIPIVLVGLFPWSGFLLAGGRSALRGGWTERNKNADTLFFAVWAGFIFLFFSVSHSKLPPYILPVFPALAVLVGRWMAPSPDAGPLRLRGGVAFFSFFCGLLAAALCAVVIWPGMIPAMQAMALKMAALCGIVIRPALVHGLPAAQALALRSPAIALTACLVAGGVAASWLARIRGARATLGAMVATIVLFGGILTFAAANIQRPGTKDLARFVQAHAGPSDRVLHYHEFFHDFPFYAGRLVDVVGFKGELELEEDAAARASGRFLDEAAFRGLWLQPARVFVVARKTDTQRLFADSTFTYHLLAQSEDHYLFSNEP